MLPPPRRRRPCRRAAPGAGELDVREVRPAEARGAPRAPSTRSRGRAAATSGVSLPSRRSSPTGLPVTATSPNTPSRSSRIWNASPSGRPNALSGPRARRGGRPARRRGAAAARRCTCPTCSARSEPPAPGRCCRSRCPRGRGTGPTQSSTRSSSNTRRAIGGGRAEAGCRRTRTRSRRRGSPRPRRTAAPRRATLRRRGGSMNRRWIAGRPRRRSDPSITSSCTSANVCSSSSAAPASTTTGSSGSPPAPTNAQWQNAGRSRLPPATTSSRSATSGSASSGSTVAPPRDLVVEQRRRSSPRPGARPRPGSAGSTTAPSASPRAWALDAIKKSYAADLRSRMTRVHSPYDPPVTEFLSAEWIAGLDAAARAATLPESPLRCRSRSSRWCATRPAVNLATTFARGRPRSRTAGPGGGARPPAVRRLRRGGARSSAARSTRRRRWRQGAQVQGRFAHLLRVDDALRALEDVFAPVCADDLPGPRTVAPTIPAAYDAPLTDRSVTAYGRRRHR